MENEARLLFPLGFDARAQEEMESKGWISLLIALSDGRGFVIHCTTPVRLSQDIDECFGAGANYYAEHGMVVIDRVSMEDVVRTTQSLIHDGFLDNLKPVEWRQGDWVEVK